MGKEFELKYRATPELLARIEAALPGEYHRLNMTTYYYDTPGGELSRRKWTLRRRMENERSVCTLKTPAPGLLRGEWETACDDLAAALPLLAEQAGLPELTELAKEGLVLTCGASFVRRYRMLTLENAEAELALDTGVLRSGTKELPFAEAELELKSGSEDALLAFARQFQTEFGLDLEHRSKFARARALGQEG